MCRKTCQPVDWSIAVTYRNNLRIDLITRLAQTPSALTFPSILVVEPEPRVEKYLVRTHNGPHLAKRWSRVGAWHSVECWGQKKSPSSPIPTLVCIFAATLAIYRLCIPIVHLKSDRQDKADLRDSHGCAIKNALPRSCSTTRIGEQNRDRYGLTYLAS